MNEVNSFGKIATKLSTNPLGIIALFIVLVYGLACTLFITASDKLEFWERIPIIYFVIIFPILVLILFIWLVVNHHNKLYAPKDFGDNDGFHKAMQQNNIYKSINKDSVKDLLEYGKKYKTVLKEEKVIKQDLEKRGITNINDTTVQILTGQLAASHILKWFERTYSIIYGSQIKLLEELLVAEKVGFDIEKVERRFRRTKRKNPDFFEDLESNEYLEFLYISRLIKKEDNKVLITDEGTDFIKILEEVKYTKEKSL